MRLGKKNCSCLYRLERPLAWISPLPTATVPTALMEMSLEMARNLTKATLMAGSVRDDVEELIVRRLNGETFAATRSTGRKRPCH